jgi:hypothetical protein
VSFALQRKEDVPGPYAAAAAARAKPWGTGQAVLAAARQVAGPFAVVNADDFYGRAAYESLGAFLRAEAAPGVWAIAGYRLAKTLSDVGTVNRGVCQVDVDGWLVSMEEVVGLHRTPDGAFVGHGLSSDAAHAYDGDALVSQNMWGFTPDVFDLLRDRFARFLHGHSTDPKAEFLLPTVAREVVAEARVRVKVLDPDSRWFGITHPGDRAAVVRAIAELVVRGEYPRHPWPRA